MNQQNISILFRVNANKNVALGHLKRCISLANKLRINGSSISFLIGKDEYSENILRNNGMAYNTIPCGISHNEEGAETLRIAKLHDVNIVVMDSYDITPQYIELLVAKGYFTVSIDDIADRVIPSHMIINGNLHAEKLNYLHENTIFKCLGIEYLILGPDFEKEIETVRDCDVQDVLITMGGIDHYDLTSSILSLLDVCVYDFQITAIIGPYYENIDSIGSLSRKMKKKVRLIHAPPSLFDYMKECSMAFSAGGQTLYELAALGVPTVGVTLWDNQAGNVKELSEMGAIEGLVYQKDGSFTAELARKTLRILMDKDHRERLSMAASEIVDGRGAQRSTDAIIASYNMWFSNNSGKEYAWKN